MTLSIESAIQTAEQQLAQAMLSSDVNLLDQLLAPDLIFTNHLGQVLSKQDDLAAHQSGIFKIDALTPSEQQILVRGETAIVTVRVRIVGSYDGTLSDNNFRFTRVWAKSAEGNWQVVAGHSSVVTE